MRIFLLLILLVSCGKNSDSSDRAQNQEGPGGIVFDSELSSDEKRTAEETLQTLSSVPIDGSQVRGFAQMFGGNVSSNVFTYVDERVNYLISENTSYRSRITPASFTPYSASQIYASNPSVFIWYEAIYNRNQDLNYVINGEEIDINSSRVGVMQIGEGLVQADPTVKASTIVHEARHSDCKGGALASDIESYNTNGDSIANLECGHFHGVCPPGHIFEGMVACDLHPWGAYIADAIYSDAIVRTCETCTEAQKQAAAINRADTISRPAYDVGDMLDGKLGPADMSTSNQVR